MQIEGHPSSASSISQRRDLQFAFDENEKRALDNKQTKNGVHTEAYASVSTR